MAQADQTQPNIIRRCLTVDSLFLKLAEIKPGNNTLNKEIRDSDNESPNLKIFQAKKNN